jgi:hypothetical protein
MTRVILGPQRDARISRRALPRTRSSRTARADPARKEREGVFLAAASRAWRARRDPSTNRGGRPHDRRMPRGRNRVATHAWNEVHARRALPCMRSSRVARADSAHEHRCERFPGRLPRAARRRAFRCTPIWIAGSWRVSGELMFGATTVDIAEPLWRLIKNGAVEKKEIADCLQPGVGIRQARSADYEAACCFFASARMPRMYSPAS